LIVGCGDVGLRAAALLTPRLTVLALTSSGDRVDALRERGLVPLKGNLDQKSTLSRLAGVATHVLHLAPPPQQGWTDPRTLTLLQALRRRALPAVLVYGSTSGVYGDCGGQWVDESRAYNAATPRGVRRVDAERQLRFWSRSTGVRTNILRIPGIYAKDRDGGTPRERLQKGTPVLQAQDDVYTNHIQADDLARACVVALWRGKPLRCYNVSDDTELKMGDYFDLAADIYQLPRPPRVAREGAQAQLSAMLLSFMSESRRLNNQRMKNELGLKLRYPTVREGLA
jgi:nucleoside-diphosphate-sugar epimerase